MRVNTSAHQINTPSLQLSIFLQFVTCSVPGGSSSQPVSLQQNYVGHTHFSQVVDSLTAQTASSNHHHICWPEAGDRDSKWSWADAT